MSSSDPCLFNLQDINDFKGKAAAFCRQHGAQCSFLCISHTPELLQAFMGLTNNLVRLHLLARHLPYKRIIQLYTLVYATVEVLPLSLPAVKPCTLPCVSPSGTGSHRSATLHASLRTLDKFLSGEVLSTQERVKLTSKGK